MQRAPALATIRIFFVVNMWTQAAAGAIVNMNMNMNMNIGEFESDHSHSSVVVDIGLCSKRSGCGRCSCSWGRVSTAALPAHSHSSVVVEIGLCSKRNGCGRCSWGWAPTAALPASANDTFSRAVPAQCQGSTRAGPGQHLLPAPANDSFRLADRGVRGY